MLKSTAFYPEYLEKDKWMENMLKIKAGGIGAIRFGEFAWGLIEPQEDSFYWDLFDEAFDMAESVGLKVILGTPTACPPIWLTEKYPDALPVNEAGDIISFGGRQHRCYNAPAYRRRAAVITVELAKRYGRRKGLYAWQIDNELAAEHKYCYCDTCAKKYQAFLREKYGTIDALNKRWMTTFWAQNYTSFSQVRPPEIIRAYLPVKPHPSQVYEFLRFSSESVAEFCDMQFDVIRRHSDRIITSNQDDFSMGDNTDWYRIFQNLDVAAFDIYTKNLYEIGFYFDFSRSLKSKPSWLVEFDCNSPVLKGVLDLADEKGCGMVGLFKFNPFPAGQEQSRYSLVDLFGNESENYYVFRDWIKKVNWGQNPAVYMHYDFLSSWAYSAEEYRTWEEGHQQRQSRLVYQRYMIHTVYKAFFDNTFDVDFPICTGAVTDISRVFILPMQIIYDQKLEDILLRFIKAGGRVIATNDLFVKNQDNVYLTEMPRIYMEIMGDEARYVEFEWGAPVVKKFSYEKGEIWFVNVNADYDIWKGIAGLVKHF